MVEFDDDTPAVFGSVLAMIGIGLLVTGVLGIELSLTGQSILLMAFFLGLFSVKLTYRRSSMLAVFVIAASVLTFFYVPVLFGIQQGLSLLLGFSVMFLSIGVLYRVHRTGQSLFWRHTRVIVGVLLIVSLIVVGVDLSVGDVEYTFDFKEQVRLSGDDTTVTVGTATARATSFLREPADFPDLRACLYHDGSRTEVLPVYGDTWSDSLAGVPGGGSLSLDVRIPLSRTQARQLPETLPIERATSCPENRNTTGIVMVVPSEG